MNKQILLILATALAQIVNVLQGSTPTVPGSTAPATPTPAPAKKNGRARKLPEPATELVEEEEEIEVEAEEEEEEIEVEEDEAVEVDIEELKKEAKKLVTALVTKDAANGKKVRAILDAHGETNIGKADDDNIAPILAALKKIK